MNIEEPKAGRRFGVERYSEQSLQEAIEDLDEHPLGVHDDSELSLAGLQDKLLLVDLGEKGWGRPLHGRPSTHILKLDDRLRPGLVEAEAECLELARALGLTDVDVGLETVGESRCLIVSRLGLPHGGSGVRRVDGFDSHGPVVDERRLRDGPRHTPPQGDLASRSPWPLR